MMSNQFLALLLFSILCDFVYFKLSRPLVRSVVYVLLFTSLYFISEGLFQAEYIRTIINCSLLFFALMFPFSRLLESKYEWDIPFVFRGLLVPFSMLTMVSFDSIIALTSTFSCLSMFHTEIRIRYLLLYSGLSSIFLLKIFAANYFSVIGLIIVTISSLCILLNSSKSKVDLLFGEVGSTNTLKFALLINCVLTIAAITLCHLQSLSTSNLYVSLLSCMLTCYAVGLKVKRI